MMHGLCRTFLFTSSLVLVALPGAGDPPETATMDCRNARGDSTSITEIGHTFESWRTAVREGDLDALVDLVTEDAEFWTHSRPALTGREALRTAFAPVLGAYEMDQEIDCQELVVEGPLAFFRGMEINRISPVGGGEPMIQRQRAFSILQRGDDGVWRFARGMTNLPPQDEEGAGG